MAEPHKEKIRKTNPIKKKRSDTGFWSKKKNKAAKTPELEDTIAPQGDGKKNAV